MARTTVSLNYLIPRLRLNLGDTDATSQRYLDEWLRLALVASIESLQKWWNYKYLVEDDDDVYRNPNITTFLHAQPPVIERGDIRPIVLMASIVLKSGDLQNMSWNVGAWRDAEISYSNIEASRRKGSMIEGDWDELKSILKPPQKRLSFARKKNLAGYGQNTYEKGDTPEESG